MNAFNSWRHERPDFIGATWKYHDCQVQIVHTNEAKLNVKITIVSAGQGQMTVRTVKGSTFTFRRIKSPR